MPHYAIQIIRKADYLLETTDGMLAEPARNFATKDSLL